MSKSTARIFHSFLHERKNDFRYDTAGLTVPEFRSANTGLLNEIASQLAKDFGRIDLHNISTLQALDAGILMFLKGEGIYKG